MMATVNIIRLENQDIRVGSSRDLAASMSGVTHYRGNIHECLWRTRNSPHKVKSRFPPRSDNGSASARVRFSSGMMTATESSFGKLGALRPRMSIGRCLRGLPSREASRS